MYLFKGWQLFMTHHFDSRQMKHYPVELKIKWLFWWLKSMFTIVPLITAIFNQIEDHLVLFVFICHRYVSTNPCTFLDLFERVSPKAVHYRIQNVCVKGYGERLIFVLFCQVFIVCSIGIWTICIQISSKIY